MAKIEYVAKLIPALTSDVLLTSGCLGLVHLYLGVIVQITGYVDSQGTTTGQECKPSRYRQKLVSQGRAGEINSRLAPDSQPL